MNTKQTEPPSGLPLAPCPASSETPETARFYASFADGEATQNQDEWLALCERLERERNEWQSVAILQIRKTNDAREALARLEYERTKRDPNKIDAPGHSHDVRSHWDLDGGLCSWCDAWDQARAVLKSLPNV